MGAKQVYISTEYITLDQLLKWAGLVMTGGEGKLAIADGLVKVNGQTETRRGRKLREGDTVSFGGREVAVTKGKES
ncbi:MAG TPA: S4 domain-containing protein YaaA [Bacillota bacterium]|nr:MAG: ribosome-associated protein [Firmicutes bacterium ADurb.Bin153]HNV34131.1 S4 domain-containing protein YaaA [Bacillota bacterium]HPU95241.1 S4 domain-containing protein YaaA [Bacillota bacterium]